METNPGPRATWEIDRILEQCMGCDVRVAARQFSPIPIEGGTPIFLPVQNIVLADQTRPDQLPVFFEGRLHSFYRQIGVVRARLDSPRLPNSASDGLLTFRGRLAIFIRGPAIVELEYPISVERLPEEEMNYWADIRLPSTQFLLPLGGEIN